MSAFSLLSFITITTIVTVLGIIPKPPTTNIPTLSDSQLLPFILSHLSKDELIVLDPIMTSSQSLTDLYDTATWKDRPEWQQTLHSIQAANGSVKCALLDLSSTACYDACTLYNDLLSWIPIIVFNETKRIKKLLPIAELYSMSSGGPLSWQSVGNPDVCEYIGGNYCYTPSMKGTFVQMHACCIPGSCTGEDAIKVLHNNSYCYDTFNSVFHVTMDICEPIPRDLNKAGPMIVILLFFAFVLLIIVASVARRYCIEYRRLDSTVVDQNVFISVFNVEGLWADFRKVRPADKTQFNFLDGVRCWSMSWVILGHSFIYMFGASNALTFVPAAVPNKNWTYLVQRFYTMFIQYAFYSVDSFFFLSGFFGAFSIWRSIQKYGSVQRIVSTWYIWIPMAYLMRFLRLTPMMMFVTAIQWQLGDQLAYGYHVMERSTNTAVCNEDWYKILFYYANLMITKNDQEALGCMGQLWYIQADFQMFLLLPFMVLLFAMNRVVGLISAAIPIIICVIIRIVYAFYYNFAANEIWPSVQPKHGGDLMSQSYFMTWPRMSVYFIGVLLMFIMIVVNEKHKDFTLTKLHYLACVTLSGFLMLCLVVWPYQDVEDVNNRWNNLQNNLYYAFSRPVWGLALALLTFGLRYIGSNQESITKGMLSCEVYQCIGKLTFTMYLLHLTVFGWWSSDNDMSIYYDVWSELFLVIGMWSIVAAMSFVLWMIMEKPLANTTNALVKYMMKACVVEKRNDDQQNRLLNQNVANRKNIAVAGSGYGEAVFDRSFIVNTKKQLE